jgi:hypothetical protein
MALPVPAKLAKSQHNDDVPTDGVAYNLLCSIIGGAIGKSSPKSIGMTSASAHLSS